MAITAAAVAVAATSVAATAYSASQSGKGGTAGGGYIPPSAAETRFNRSTADILDSERSILDDAIAQGKLVEPEMYKALGLEPVYDRPEDPEAAKSASALAAAQGRFNEIRQREIELRVSRPGKGLKGADRRQALKGKKQELKKLGREKDALDRAMPVLSRDVEQRGAVGRRVVGFKPLAGIADPTGSAGGAFGSALDDFNAHLSDALAGKAPLDPTLQRTFDDREQVLRERLRRQLGTDYETTTAGEQALALLDRERSEAYAAYNTDAIKSYSGLAENRAGALANLTSNRIKNLALPSAFREQLGGALESAAAERRQFAQGPVDERNAKGAAALRAEQIRQQQRAERTAAIAGLIKSTGSAVGSVGGGYGGAAAEATPSTVSVPNYGGGGAASGGGGYTGETGYSGLAGSLLA